ncbi:MAG: diaminopimelate epimerase [Acidimicrobiales bacterium]
MHLTKHHGLGNDFLVTFAGELPTDAPDIALELCDRSTGIGADGLIFGVDEGSDVKMRLYNSDGSPAEISGNGLRCFVQAVAMRRGVTHLEIDVDTLAGIRACVAETTDDPAVMYATVDMGPVTEGDAPDTVAFLDTIDGLTGIRRWAVGAVGNPHVVIEIEDPDSVDLASVGPAVEKHFANGVNVHFVATSGPDAVTLRVWERGAGITRACGSGATVSAQRMHEWGRVGERASIAMPGGTAEVDVMTAERPSARLSGTATFVGTVQVPRG